MEITQKQKEFIQMNEERDREREREWKSVEDKKL